MSVKPVLSSHPGKLKKWLLRAGGYLAEVNIGTKLKFGNILVDCFIKVTANSGLVCLYLIYPYPHPHPPHPKKKKKKE